MLAMHWYKNCWIREFHSICTEAGFQRKMQRIQLRARGALYFEMSWVGSTMLQRQRDSRGFIVHSKPCWNEALLIIRRFYSYKQYMRLIKLFAGFQFILPCLSRVILHKQHRLEGVTAKFVSSTFSTGFSYTSKWFLSPDLIT